jgi:hypothetical protein
LVYHLASAYVIRTTESQSVVAHTVPEAGFQLTIGILQRLMRMTCTRRHFSWKAMHSDSNATARQRLQGKLDASDAPLATPAQEAMLEAKSIAAIRTY